VAPALSLLLSNAPPKAVRDPALEEKKRSEGIINLVNLLARHPRGPRLSGSAKVEFEDWASITKEQGACGIDWPRIGFEDADAGAPAVLPSSCSVRN